MPQRRDATDVVSSGSLVMVLGSQWSTTMWYSDELYVCDGSPTVIAMYDDEDELLSSSGYQVYVVYSAKAWGEWEAARW